MCVQNDMLTIAGEVRVQTGPHPNPLPKTLTGPDLQRFELVQTCRGMRGFTDFCLCSTRAKLAPVSAHLSICRNFTTALPGPRHRVATRCRDSARMGPHRPVCMYRHGWPGDCDLFRDPGMRAKKALCRVDPSRFTGRGAHCTAHRNGPVPKILTSPALNSVTRMPKNPRHTRDRPPGPPEKPHLIEKSAAPTEAKAAPEKSHRNRRGIKNVNGIRYLCAASVRVGPAIIPRKTSPFRHPAQCDSCLSAPENSHLCQKVAQRKSDFDQSGRAFQRIFPGMTPEKPHL